MIVRVLGMGRNWWAERVPRLELAFVRRGQFGRRSTAELEENDSHSSEEFR